VVVERAYAERCMCNRGYALVAVEDDAHEDGARENEARENETREDETREDEAATPEERPSPSR
jgi:hypothetical protein